MRKFLLLLLCMMILTVPCYAAEIKEIIAVGTYNMGDGETPEVAEERALIQAKRIAIEQTGTYIESYTEVENYQLKKDEVWTLSSGIMKVTILEKQRELNPKGGLYFVVKIKATITTDNISDMIARLRERSTTNRVREIQQGYATLDLAHTVALNSRQADLAANNEKLWLSNYWSDVGTGHFLRREYEQATSALIKSYNLNRNTTAALLLGDINFDQGQYKQALHWYLTVNSEEAYWKQGLTNEALNEILYARYNYEKIVGSLMSTSNSVEISHIGINSKNDNAWFRLGIVNDLLGDKEQHRFRIGVNPSDWQAKEYYQKALFCLGQVITLSPNYDSAYYQKARIYEKINKPYEASQEYKKFLQIASLAHPNYHGAEQRLQNLKSHYGIL